LVEPNPLTAVISYNLSISSDGRFVALHSDASNLVGGDTNGSADVFVRGPLIRRIRLLASS
jgi:hypothetical protein